MAEVADQKLVQYLNEAYAKEKELEAALTAHIAMTTRKPYRKRLEDHLKETKGHSRALERRMKKLGHGPASLAKLAGQAAGQAKSLAKGPLHMLRGLGEAEKMLKNAKTEYWNEHEEIATYTAIESLAESLGDKETAKVARAIRREEERMAAFLERQITQLAKAVAREEVPASERAASGGRSRRRSSTARSRKASSSRSSSGSRSSRTRAKSSRSSGSRAKSTRSSGSRARSGSGRSSGTRGTTARRRSGSRSS
jgi:ferritin-like metal-binding protein YciE